MNVTGTWQPKYWTLQIALQQWDGTRLVLVANNFDPKRKGVCKPRGVFTLTGTTVTRLTTVWWEDTKKPHRGPWTRLSPDGGPAEPYPYATELTFCGSLRTYELVFATGSPQLQGDDAPILAGVAEALKANTALKIQIAGHTDAVGDAAKNQELSEQRAAAVKKVLVDKHSADAARITTKGWGSEQPVADNTTDDGRALNRRVEIVLAR